MTPSGHVRLKFVYPVATNCGEQEVAALTQSSLLSDRVSRSRINLDGQNQVFLRQAENLIGKKLRWGEDDPLTSEGFAIVDLFWLAPKQMERSEHLR